LTEVGPIDDVNNVRVIGWSDYSGQLSRSEMLRLSLEGPDTKSMLRRTPRLNINAYM